MQLQHLNVYNHIDYPNVCVTLILVVSENLVFHLLNLNVKIRIHIKLVLCCLPTYQLVRCKA